MPNAMNPPQPPGNNPTPPTLGISAGGQTPGNLTPPTVGVQTGGGIGAGVPLPVPGPLTQHPSVNIGSGGLPMIMEPEQPPVPAINQGTGVAKPPILANPNYNPYRPISVANLPYIIEPGTEITLSPGNANAVLGPPPAGAGNMGVEASGGFEGGPLSVRPGPLLPRPAQDPIPVTTPPPSSKPTTVATRPVPTEPIRPVSVPTIRPSIPANIAALITQYLDPLLLLGLAPEIALQIAIGLALGTALEIIYDPEAIEASRPGMIPLHPTSTPQTPYDPVWLQQLAALAAGEPYPYLPDRPTGQPWWEDPLWDTPEPDDPNDPNGMNQDDPYSQFSSGLDLGADPYSYAGGNVTVTASPPGASGVPK